MRFYDPQIGSVTIDGVDLRELRQRDLRDAVALVSQDVFLFHGTVAENIAYGVPDATHDEIIEAARTAEAHEFIVGLRYTADEAEAGGITPEEGLEISRRLADCGMVDFLNVIRGRIHTDPAMTDVIPVQGMRSAPPLDFAGAVKAATGMPTFHAARIPDVATARHAVQAGLLDMVGMTRAHMADPHIVKKIVAGREDDIRPCVGATFCLDRIYAAGEALCIHNPATGRELSMPHEIAPAETRRRAVIRQDWRPRASPQSAAMR